MDIPRLEAGKRRFLRRTVFAAAGVCVATFLALGIARLRPANPEIERGSVWLGSVKRGDLYRQVRGLGSLTPEEVFWVAASSSGRVLAVKLRPGVSVSPETVILLLSNPQLELEAGELGWQLKAAEANFADLRVRLETQRLDIEAALARAESEYIQAKLKRDRDEQLVRERLAPDLDLKLSRAAAEEAAKRHEIERKRLAIFGESIRAQLDAQKVNIEKLRAAWQLKRREVEELTVRAGIAGVLQEVAVEVGQNVAAGSVLAKVASPSRLKAELKIPETQAKDIEPGQEVAIDTRNGWISGRVWRIDPAVVNGTVRVDVRLEEPLPKGARPDLSVEGVIRLEQMRNVLYIERPATGGENSTASLFRLDPKSGEAVRVKVRFGRSSVTHLEVLDGLREGDQVILSDMSAWESHDRIRLVR